MNCEKCGNNFPENKIEESHDVPCYLFFLESKKRNDRKKYADKYNRRWYCRSCHLLYEFELRNKFIELAKEFGIEFRGDDGNS